MPPGSFTVRVNDAGFRRKLDFVVGAISESFSSPLITPMRRGFRRHIKTEYVRILKTELPRSKEIELLNKGFVVRRGGEIFALRSQNPKGVVGSTAGGRFLTASWTPMARAVAESEIEVDLTAPRHVVRVGSVRSEEIRRRTSFSWAIRDKKGRFQARGTTQPFGRQYLEVLEKGGRISVPKFGRLIRDTRVVQGRDLKQQGDQWIWTISHRRGKRLHPEEGVFIWAMEKRLTPIGMFKRALFTKTPAVMIEVRTSLVTWLTSGFVGFLRGGGS